MSDSDSKSDDKKPIIVKNATDLQRLKLEKLMKNPDKPVIIPDPPKQKSLAAPPDFVRNVMGSSAGAGSGEFHVYRHLRRKEYARQKFIQEKSEKEKLEDQYHQKIEENRRLAEERTAKKRAKRLKKKKNNKLKGKKPKVIKDDISLNSDSSSDEETDPVNEAEKKFQNEDTCKTEECLKESLETSNSQENIDEASNNDKCVESSEDSQGNMNEASNNHKCGKESSEDSTGNKKASNNEKCKESSDSQRNIDETSNDDKCVSSIK